MSKSRVISEHSAGGVVYRWANSHYDIVVVQRARHGDWSLPKGHVEAAESAEQAAIREIKEETGLEARVEQPIGEVVYFFRRPNGDLIRKTVYHYLLEAETTELGGPNREVSEVRWIPIQQADQLLSYANDKEIVSKATALLGWEVRGQGAGPA